MGSSLAVVLGGVGQAVILPLLLASLGSGAAGAYTTLVLLCVTFALVFGLATVGQYVSGRLKPSDLEVHDAAFALIGLCDCLNGLLTVFSSALGRTPGALQATLPQLAIPFTLASSYCLFRVTLIRQEVIGACLVIIGILVTLAPSLGALGSSSVSDPLYPILFAVGVIPGVLTNVLQTGIYRRHPGFNKVLFLFYRSSYQALFAAALFWTDLLPGLGTSTSLADMGDHLSFGITCLFHPLEGHPKCYDAWWLGMLFTAAYIATYAGGAYVIEAASANYAALLSTANTPLAAMVWFLAPGLTAWAGGSAYTSLELGIGIGALFVLIVPGSLLYKLAETKKRAEAATSSDFASTELALAGASAAASDSLMARLLDPSEKVHDAEAPSQAAASEAAAAASSSDGHEPDAAARHLQSLRYLRRLIDAELARATAEVGDTQLLVYVR